MRKLIKINVQCCLMLILLFSVWGCSDNQSTAKVIRLAHGLDINHPVHLALVRFKDELAEISGGELAVQVFPAGQLGTEREIIELIPSIKGLGISGFIKLPYKDTRFFEHQAQLPTQFYPRDPKQKSSQG